MASNGTISSNNHVIVLGGGCFWCLEAYYVMLNGILSVTSGYAGGKFKNPNYSQVASGSTGHAEVVKLTYNPKIISIKSILQVFWSMHDPTTLNRQGADIGTQYRSIILVTNASDLKTANEVKTKMQIYWENPIVTEIAKLDEFYPAEDYHQNYYKNNPSSMYCQVIINPKISGLKSKFKEFLKD